MQANWQAPFPLDGMSLPSLPYGEASERAGGPPEPAGSRRGTRDRFDYWLIVSVCLPLFFWVGLIERCNPQFWKSGAGSRGRASLWSLAKQSAHHCAKLALQG